MRDGVRLNANIFRPAASGRFPTILVRTPYDKGAEITPNYKAFVDRGYVVVAQDVRGRYASAGVFEPLNQEVADGDDTLNWIARQLWSDGQVGMMGGSYSGIAQWKAGLAHNRHLKAIFPSVSGDDDYRDRFYSAGGAMKLGHRLIWLAENMRAPGFEMPDFKRFIWHMPVRSSDVAAAGQRLDLWQQAANHPDYDAFWKQISVRDHLKDFTIPVYSAGGWFDNYVESDLDAFSILTKQKKPARIVIGPWAHNMLTKFANVDFGGDSTVPLRAEQLEWFDFWMKAKLPVKPATPMRIFVMGTNQWRDEPAWPLNRAKEAKFYLSSGGRANSLDGDGQLMEHVGKLDRHAKAELYTQDTYVYDPLKPVQTMGGAVCCDQKLLPAGPMDQRAVERRHDVLVYTTAPLEFDTEVTGPIKLVLYAASNAYDTDFTAKVVDVFPNGEARNLTDGILRARYRDGLDKQRLLIPGEAYKFTIDAGVTSNVFRAGHRIRLEVSSSNFPRFDRNPNTGHSIADDLQLRTAIQTVFHDAKRHSYLSMPIVPTGSIELTSGKPTRYVSKRVYIAPVSPPVSGAVAKR